MDRLCLLLDNGVPRVRANARHLLATACQAHSGPSLHAAAAGVRSGLRDGRVLRAGAPRVPPLLERLEHFGQLPRRLHTADVHLLHNVQRDCLHSVLPIQHPTISRSRHQVVHKPATYGSSIGVTHSNCLQAASHPTRAAIDAGGKK